MSKRKSDSPTMVSKTSHQRISYPVARKRVDGEMYQRPCARDGFPNPFTCEYMQGYSAGLIGAPIDELNLDMEYRAGYRDGQVQDELDMTYPYREA